MLLFTVIILWLYPGGGKEPVANAVENIEETARDIAEELPEEELEEIKLEYYPECEVSFEDGNIFEISQEGLDLGYPQFTFAYPDGWEIQEEPAYLEIGYVVFFASPSFIELEVEEQILFMEEYGLKESGLDKLIRASYDLLDLITFFTAGKTEVRAWTVKRGWKAPQAAGTIHSDFERGYIKAEVIKLTDYQKFQTELACKEAGKIGVEGKSYEVKDGDIMHFRFNV